MAGPSDIRAGKAFVEAYLDKTKLAKGLASVSKDLKAFGAGINSLGTKFSILGAAIVTPLLAATVRFMHVGSALADMSARTGLSTNALSELGFAAEQSGASLEDVESGVRKMQKAISEATKGPLVQLKGLAPEEQFMAVAESLKAIEDPSERAAKTMEVFGKSGTKLLPMLGDLKALRAEAVRLGLSMGPEQAAAADALGDAWDKVKGSFKASALAIGGALAPMLTGLADKATEYVGIVRKWVSEHKPLIVTIFAAGVAAIGAGAGLMILGKAVAITGTLLTTLTVVTKAATAALTFMGTTAALLANPYLLLGAAVLGLGGYALYASGAFRGMGTSIAQTFRTLSDAVTESLGVMADSMAAGDFASAAKVGWALVKMEWQRGVAFVTELWEGFKGIYDEITTGLAISFVNASVQIQGIWADLLNWMSKKWKEFGASAFTETLASWIAPLSAKFSGLDTEEVLQNLKEDFARARAGQGAEFAGMDAATAAKKKAIEDARAAQVAGRGGDLSRRNAERDARIKAARNEVDAARAEWQVAKRDAAAKAAQKAAEGGKIPGLGGVDLNATKASVRGTFAASAVAGLAVGVQQKIAQNTLDIKTTLKAIRAEARRIGLEAAP